MSSREGENARPKLEAQPTVFFDILVGGREGRGGESCGERGMRGDRWGWKERNRNPGWRITSMGLKGCMN